MAEELVHAVAHESATQSREDQVLAVSDYFSEGVRLAANTIEVADPARKVFMPSSRTLT